MSKLDLKQRLSSDGRLEVTERGYRLGILAGGPRSYRLAQLDDQLGRRRSAYPWRAPVRLELRARISTRDAPGTWGFGFWNDPYGFSFGPGEILPRLPTLPQAAWFFHASSRCHLSFRDDKPAKGFYAQVFSSRGFDTTMAKAILAFPFTPRTTRKLLGRTIDEDAAPVAANPCEWHTYTAEWTETGTAFQVDDTSILETRVSPRGPLGLVLWIDNQYAAFDPQGRISWGVESNATEEWLELEDIRVGV